jgi:hypothetical protein
MGGQAQLRLRGIRSDFACGGCVDRRLRGRIEAGYGKVVGRGGAQHDSSTTPSESSTTSSTTAADKKNKRKAADKKTPSNNRGSSGTTTHSGSSTTTSRTAHHSPTSTHSGGSAPTATSSARTTAPVPTVPPLPSPTVSGSSGGLSASLHADNHAPKAAKLWYYSVRAVDSGGHALSGTVDTEFVFGGQVVGREAPPTHPLKSGLLDRDGVTYPARSIGIPLTFRVVIHTDLGTVTLNWPVQVKR